MHVKGEGAKNMSPFTPYPLTRQVHESELLVRLDYRDGDYFVGAVHAFLQGYEIAVNAMWSANRNTQRTGLEVIQSIRRDIGFQARDEMSQSDVVIVESGT